MNFISFNFLIFFPLVGFIYFLIPKKYKVTYLLAVSILFYANMKPVFALLLLFTAIITYFSGVLISGSENEKNKRIFQICGIILILLPLLFFKYFNAINEYLNEILELSGIKFSLPVISLLLPAGISFYTFAAIGYIIDVYNEKILAEKNILNIGLFVSFFPLLFSGPIERGRNMLPQFRDLQPFNYESAVKGLKFMLWGYFMKLVVADRVAIYVDAVFNNILNHSGVTIIFTIFLYSFQIYADFGGYSLIAIGCAKMLGLNVMQNFKRPYFSKNISEFWTRWHISLSSWVRDYIFLPIAYKLTSSKNKILTSRNKLIYFTSAAVTMTVIGIWHGIEIGFLIWSSFHIVFLFIGFVYKKRKAKIFRSFIKSYNLRKVISISVTFILIAFSWIFFKAESWEQIKDVAGVFSRMFTQKGGLFLDEATIGYSIIGIVILLFKDFLDEFFPVKFNLMNNKNIIVRYSTYLALTILILLIGVFDGGQFIYFQF